MKIKIVSEGFSANSGLANIIKLINTGKLDPEIFGLPSDIKQQASDVKLISKDIFSFASMFPKDTFKIQDILSGKLEQKVKAMYINDDQIKAAALKINVLKEIVKSLDEYFGDRSWTKKF
jgi:hypothetical protein